MFSLPELPSAFITSSPMKALPLLAPKSKARTQGVEFIVITACSFHFLKQLNPVILTL
ncbi:hypothetical protein D3C77_275760 [compost metagenome]